jgi:polysaccharide export outer membrane protein
MAGIKIATRKLYPLALTLMLSAGCGASSQRNTASVAAGEPSVAAGASGDSQIPQLCETEGPLRELRARRMSADNSYDYPLGSGDVLHLNAAELPELNNVTVRVNGEGHIDLPLLGDLRVGGLSEGEVRRLIDQTARKYQKEPRIHVFIRHFAGRNVSVMGMVAQPGSYPLDSPDESILSVLGRAGGIKGMDNEEAADMLVLFPARPGDGAGPERGGPAISPECVEAVGIAASDAPHGCTGATMLNQVSASGADARGADARGSGARVEPIIIDLSKPTMANCLDTPARPGDVVVVPAAGQVGVYGWVAKPGSFNITPGMTVLGAVTSAGGAMFSSSAEVKRTEHGARVSIPINLSKVERGEQSDVPVRAGDVVLVRASATGALPYAVYTLFNKFGTGLYLAPAAM